MSVVPPSGRCLRSGSGLILASLVTLALAGRAEAQAADPAPAAGPMATWSDGPPRHANDWSGPITLARLVQAAWQTHPTANAIAAARAAAAAQVQQAGTWDNPEFELSIGRSRTRTDDRERSRPYGASLSQRLTWWGTRNARIDAARARQSAAEAESLISRLALHADVRRAAIAYATAVDAAAQADAETRIADELVAMTAARLTAGDIDRASAARSRLEAATATIQREARQREVATALAVLRSWCDPALPDGLMISDVFDTDPTVLDAVRLATAAQSHPRLRALADAAAAAEATASAERLARIPDLTVGVFGERESEKDTYGIRLGIEIPLWSRNGAGIAAAEAAQAQTLAQVHSERLALARDLAEALGAARTAQAEAKALSDLAVPAAEEAIRLRTTAYQAGEASMSDLLEARRSANAVHADLRDARRRAALALVDLTVAVGELSP